MNYNLYEGIIGKLIECIQERVTLETNVDVRP